MAATHTPTADPAAEGVAMLTYVAARFKDQRDFFDERHGRLEDRIGTLVDKADRDHAQVIAAIGEVSAGVGLLRDRLDTKVDGLDERVDGLESFRDQHTGGRTAMRLTLTNAVALIGGSAGLASLLNILFG